jgi:peptide/nickel transport system permease protein
VIGFQDPNAQQLRDRLLPPFSASAATAERHWLGTDHLGRDVFSRVAGGIWASGLVAFPATLLSSVVGATLGMVAGYRPPGLYDVLLMRLVDIQLAIPFLILALILVAVLPRGFVTLILAFAIADWAVFARVARAEARLVNALSYVDAARALGAGSGHILLRHILPNIAPIIVVLSALNIAKNAVAEASLSFLGLGVPPPTPSLGSIIADGRGFIQSAWWIAAVPGLVLFVAVLSINFLSEYLLERLNPASS